MVQVTRKEHFSASHRLHNPDWSSEKNAEVFGKCNNPNGHGHNYEIEVTVAGEAGSDTGMVIDLTKLSAIINEKIIDRVDHKHMNHDVDFLRGIIPTAENMAIAFWKILKPAISEGRLVSVKLYESANNFVEYKGE
ncbi:MAG: 6-carboxytetrahydropterin synthase [Ignavibacteriae bacterium]|nr:6-carboxytetrahydropterin synthase [Ignavibacteriota bacterium]